MSSTNYDEFSELLSRHDLLAEAAEVHGVLTGLLCGGIPMDGRSWRSHFNILINEGFGLPAPLDAGITDVYHHLCQALVDGDMTFSPLLPSEDESLETRVDAMAKWTQGYLAGFGVACPKLAETSEEVQEAIDDMADIANLGVGDADAEELESAWLEVFEYLRVSVILCFSELGKGPQEREPDEHMH